MTYVLQMPYRLPDLDYLPKDFNSMSPREFGEKYIGSNIQRKRHRKCY